MHELSASPPQKVTVEIRKREASGEVHALMKTGLIQHTRSEDTLKFQAPSLLDYEVIALDFA